MVIIVIGIENVLMVFLDNVRPLLPDHHRRRLSVRVDHFGEYRRINYSQLLHVLHSQPLIDNSVRSVGRTHTTTAAQMVVT